MGRKSNFDKKIEGFHKQHEEFMSSLSVMDLDGLIQLYIEAKTGISNYDTGEELTPAILKIEKKISKIWAQAKLQEAGITVKKDKEE